MQINEKLTRINTVEKIYSNVLFTFQTTFWILLISSPFIFIWLSISLAIKLMVTGIIGILFTHFIGKAFTQAFEEAKRLEKKQSKLNNH